MQYKNLGTTDIKVSEIGLGTEYLLRQSKKTAIEVIREAIKAGINYFDILFSVREYLENLSDAIKGYRENIIIAGHLGNKEVQGKAKKTRIIKEAKQSFLKLLSTLKIEYVDVLIIQFISLKEYDVIFKPSNLFDLALSFQNAGKAKHIGISTHDITVAMKAIESKKFEVLMVPLNIANHYLKDRDILLNKCLADKAGLIAIKPFAGGKLLQKNRTVTIAKYQTAGLSLKKKIPTEINTVKCLNYVTSLTGVNVTLMGVKNNSELQENLKFYQSPKADINYESLLSNFKN